MALLLHRMSHPDLILTTASNMLCVFSFLRSQNSCMFNPCFKHSFPSFLCPHTNRDCTNTDANFLVCILCQTSLKLFHNYPRISFSPPFLMGFLFDSTLPYSVCCFCDQSDVTSSAPVPLCLKLLLLWFGQFVHSLLSEKHLKSLVMTEYPYIVKKWH